MEKNINTLPRLAQVKVEAIQVELWAATALYQMVCSTAEKYGFDPLEATVNVSINLEATGDSPSLSGFLDDLDSRGLSMGRGRISLPLSAREVA